jgi:hypothetical protein
MDAHHGVKHVHDVLYETCLPYSQCRASASYPCDLLAHGGHTLVYLCHCGAMRYVNMRGRYTEASDWVPRETSPLVSVTHYDISAGR